MLKSTIIYIFLSILAVVFAKYFNLILLYIDLFYTWLNLKLSVLFNHSPTAIIVVKILLLVVIPIVITAIPALIYRLITRRTMPHFIAITWCVWLVVLLSNVLIN